MLRRLITTGALLAVPGLNATAQVRQQSPDRTHTTATQQVPMRYTPAELQAAGARVMQQAIAQYGRVTDAGMQREVDAVLTRLERAADMRERIQFVIVNDTNFNAAAVPGGYMIVNVGLLTTLAKFAESEFPNDTARAHAQYLGFLASTLGHELAHHTLGHTSNLSRLAGRPSTGSTPDSALRDLEQQMANPEMLMVQRRSRTQEADADRMGSIYALRAGWTVQHAIDLFRMLGDMERQEGETRALEAVTWLRDHPRASERAARLEQLRGGLMLDQTRFDDALTLVRNGVLLDTAVTLLDTVLTHFPHLHEAQHARAAALHKQFIRQMSARDLQVRSAVGTYEANIMGAVRGAAGISPAAATALERARRAYRAVLAEQVLPYALANLAVLDAYAGDLATARARADSAVRLDTASAVVRLNRGVVHFLAAQSAEALADFRAAERLNGSSDPVTTFDIGRALLATGDTTAGAAKLTEYADADDSGPWHDLAASLAVRSGRTAGTPTRAQANQANAAGLVLPVSFGASAAAIKQALGTPEETGTYNGAVVWRYVTRGVVVVLGSKGAVLIGLSSPGAGSIDGVRVGDAAGKATAAWGAPVDQEAEMLYYRRGTLVIAVESSNGRILTMTVAKAN